MKRIVQVLAVLALVCGLSAFGGCSTTGTPHAPTTAANAGTSALVVYSVAGFTAGQYLALPLCATPAVYPCKTQVVNDRLVLADSAAYAAAVAADSAGNSPAAQAKAAAALAALQGANTDPAVKTQVDLAKKASGGAP
jgi:hypothetical protein